MRAFDVTETARKDLLEIWEYIWADNLDAADRVIDRLHDAFEKLSPNPLIGHLREDLASPPHRFFLVYSYLIIYMADTRPLQIIRVLHAARDMQNILGMAPDEL
ncbi:MAG: type II toxin-antitoxin system RelE/ParE family toxin [Bryobacteraceae bacterium]